MPSRKAAFLDRDGVLNRKAEEGDYIRSWAEFELLPGVVEALRLLQSQGYRLIVTTNQRGVARGLMRQADLDEIHSRMTRLLAGKGVQLDAIYCCPHEKGVCDCRKPAPGMLLQAAREFGDLDLSSSIMIGDSLSDMEAANRAGCPGLLVADQERARRLLAEAAQKGLQVVGSAPSLLALVEQLFTVEPRRLLFLHTIVGRGGDAVQVQAMIEALSRLGYPVERIGVGGVHPYTFGRSVSGPRSLAKRLPWWVKDLVELGLNTLVGLRGWWMGRKLRPALVMERMTPYGIGGLIAASLLNVPLAIHLDAPFAAERSFRKQPMFTRLHKAAMRWVGRKAKVIVIGSEAARAHYSAMGLPAERMLLLRNGVFADEVQGEPGPTYGLPVIGFVGSMARWHRVDLLIEALAILRSRGVDAVLWIIGMGEDYASLVRQVESCGLQDQVRFIGPVERSQILPIIRQFRAAVLPHTLDTGSPMKLFEYAAAGVPAAAPNLENIREIWGNESFALFNPGSAASLADALERLLSDPEQSNQRATTALHLVRTHYTWEQQMGQILSSALADTRKRS